VLLFSSAQVWRRPRRQQGCSRRLALTADDGGLGRRAPTFAWKVSTGDRAHATPTGSFKQTSMHEMRYSKKYDNAPMPHSVFFNGGYAVHATYAVMHLGGPASHGCVRLHPDNAADFTNSSRRSDRPTPVS